MDQNIKPLPAHGMVFSCSTDVEELIDRLIDNGDEEPVQVMSATVTSRDPQLGHVVVGFKIGGGDKANFGVSLEEAKYCADQVAAMSHQYALVRQIRIVVKQGQRDARRIRKTAGSPVASLQR
jgi:hypothetical protein